MSFGVEIPFVELLGFELRRFENGDSELAFSPRPEHMNSFAVVHGGVLMTLLDVAMATAARSVTPEHGVVTIEMKTSFMRPGSGPLTAKGHLLHRTRSMAFVEAQVLDAQQQLCAHASGTFKYVNRSTPPAGMAPRISTD
jgi:uncharacterized protein (TIGR00369 family)